MKLLVTAGFNSDPVAVARLRSLGHDVITHDDESGGLPSGAHSAEVVVCNGLFKTHSVRDFESLELVQLTSAGIDRAPVDELRNLGIQLCNARDVYSIPIAEWALMQLLSIYKRARFFQQNQIDARWEKARDLRELTGRTACIVGFGGIGMEIAKRLQAFGVKVVGVRKSPTDSPLAAQVVGPESLGSVLPIADFVILSLPLNTETTHLLDSDLLDRMKDDAVLVNVSRGAIIATDALIEALDDGKFLGVALDAFEEEPLASDSVLWGYDRVLITPHNSFVSDQVKSRLFRLFLNNLATAAGRRSDKDIDASRF